MNFALCRAEKDHSFKIQLLTQPFSNSTEPGTGSSLQRAAQTLQGLAAKHIVKR